ncbi:hypothetical protein K493DRAFT_309346 [Basidiobolus meristosporus CBS 931.73]|uniref:Uncharacterized protein n=1 Tax=Basidiobolus meristosporus CBS 931.73 TaxID=1314790 RepID=A0A1Y1W3G6_9FUNG|nr:hypothetical protein K493DRAFT_309346 [Basidiobolus meristosporus CBS 931.73]|eukprot:ORX68089.1 hypothetical protein K493DRAFT_309346 [Basidiobolus meristosporus CBS 931.73]
MGCCSSKTHNGQVVEKEYRLIYRVVVGITGRGKSSVANVLTQEVYDNNVDKAKSIDHILLFMEQVSEKKLPLQAVMFVSKGGGRIDPADEIACRTFNFILTHTNQKWVDKNVSDLERVFYPCKKFIGVDLPGVLEKMDDRLDQEEQVLRARRRYTSIEHLSNTIRNFISTKQSKLPTRYKHTLQQEENWLLHY